jgi:DNA-binding CsgD family transcriptional regulator
LDGAHTSGADILVGAQRESVQIAETLMDGTSVVLVGSLGSGKSHLLRSILGRLRRAGVDPLVIRPGGPLAEVPLGALDATRDPRAERLRTGTLSNDEPRPVLLIDDAHDLDDASAAAIVRAVYGGQATALFAVTVSRGGSPARRPEGAVAAQMTTDLWLRGLAERVDLPDLTPADAEELLLVFGGGDLDALSHATVIGLADGSRMLLRELTREALLAGAQGRDPVAAIRDARPHSRVADAVAAHVAQISPDERTALAVLGRVPRIAFSDAVRLVPADVLELLISSRLVHDDGTADRLLTANIALARGCDRVCDREDVMRSLAQAAGGMLTPDADWWSVPLARRIATMWVRGEAGMPEPDDVPADVLGRVALDAARSANDTGDHDLAATIARWGLTLRADLPLRIEALFADGGRGEPVDVAGLVAEISAQGLDCATMLRWVRMSGPLLADDPAAVAGADLANAVEASCANSLLGAELELQRAQMHALALDWEGALVGARELGSRAGASASVRMRAAVLAGMAHSSLGDADESHKWFSRARRLAGARDGVKSTTTIDRLWAYCSEIITHALAGTDARTILTRLEETYLDAALEGDPTTGTFAAFVAAAAAASIGDSDRAALELRSALRRARPPELGPMASYSQLVVAWALALQGRAGDARSLLDATDTTLIEKLPLLDHTRLTAESYVLAAEGRDADAFTRARKASAIAESAPVLLARDLFLLLALGEKQEQILPRMREIAESTSVPATRLLQDRANELVSVRTVDRRVGSYDAVRMATIWGVSDSPGDWVRKIAPAPHGPSRLAASVRSAVQDLTRREREIAILVSEGLSNREIATRLYLSVRTVESHIYQARAKVDAGSRGELGALVARVTDGPSGVL